MYVLKFELEVRMFWAIQRGYSSPGFCSMQDFCVVCMTFHGCNFAMFFLSVLEYRAVGGGVKQLKTA